MNCIPWLKKKINKNINFIKVEPIEPDPFSLCIDSESDTDSIEFETDTTDRDLVDVEQLEQLNHIQF